MKILKQFLVLGLLSVVLYGCLQVDTKVNLNSDGSGTLVETFMMKKEVLNMFKELASSFDSTETKETDLFNEEEIRNKAANFGEGVEYVSSEKISKNDFEGYKVTYSFKDINKIKINPSPDSQMPGSEMEGEDNNTDLILFNFKKGSPAVLTIIFPEEELKAEETESVDNTEVSESDSLDQLNQLVEMFDGMRVDVALNIKGKIVESDASYLDGNEITLLSMDFAELIKNKDLLIQMSKSDQMSREKFKELTSVIHGFKIETKEKITTKFR